LLSACLRLVLAVTPPPIVVGGDAHCPAPGAVQEQLARSSLPAGSEARALWLSEENAGLVVELRSASGRVLERRTLPRGDACETLALTVAVVVAAWMTELDRAALPEPVFVGSTQPTLGRPHEKPSPPIELGVGTGAFLAGTAVSWGATVEGTLGRAEGAGVRMDLTAQGPSDQVLGPGEARWQRLSLGASGRYRWRWPKIFLEPFGGLAGAVVLVRGAGYSPDSSAAGVDAALTGGIRVGHCFGRLAFWLEVTGAAWAMRNQLQVNGLPGSTTLPRFDASLMAGASWTRL
jgi:hypothetical protein